MTIPSRDFGEHSFAAARPTPLSAILALMRLYAMYAPWEKGKARVAAMMRAQLATSSPGARLELAARDRRRFSVDPREPQFWMGLIDRGVFEPQLTSVIRSLVRPGMTAVDAGANFGWFTTLFSEAVGPQGSVHAFEPMPHTAALLRENCALNNSLNVTITEAALGAVPGTADLVLQSGRACGDASMFAATNSGGGRHAPLPCYHA